MHNGKPRDRIATQTAAYAEASSLAVDAEGVSHVARFLRNMNAGVIADLDEDIKEWLNLILAQWLEDHAAGIQRGTSALETFLAESSGPLSLADRRAR
jgi:hypothetical protein